MASCTSTSARPATSACRPTPMPTSRASTPTAPASSTSRTACATAWASTGIPRAQGGSWNRGEKTGYRVMMVTLSGNGKVAKYEPFVQGWLQGQEIWGRPVYTTHMKDGSVLISDDYAGAIYRVSYSK